MTLTAALGAPAGAQPACAANALTLYLTPAFECQLAGWRFFDFQFFTTQVSSGSASGAAPAGDGSTTFLTPFTGADALGRPTFGFDFDGLLTEATVDGGDVGEGLGYAAAELVFQTASVDPSGALVGTTVDRFLQAETATPPLTLVHSFVQGLGHPLSGPAAVCMAFTHQVLGSETASGSVEQPCGPSRPSSLSTFLALSSTTSRLAGPLPEGGATTSRVDRVAFTTPPAIRAVPEPSSLALLAGALLATGAAMGRASSSRRSRGERTGSRPAPTR